MKVNINKNEHIWPIIPSQSLSTTTTKINKHVTYLLFSFHWDLFTFENMFNRYKYCFYYVFEKKQKKNKEKKNVKIYVIYNNIHTSQQNNNNGSTRKACLNVYKYKNKKKNLWMYVLY